MITLQFVIATLVSVLASIPGTSPWLVQTKETIESVITNERNHKVILKKMLLAIRLAASHDGASLAAIGSTVQGSEWFAEQSAVNGIFIQCMIETMIRLGFLNIPYKNQELKNMWFVSTNLQIEGKGIKPIYNTPKFQRGILGSMLNRLNTNNMDLCEETVRLMNNVRINYRTVAHRGYDTMETYDESGVMNEVEVSSSKEYIDNINTILEGVGTQSFYNSYIPDCRGRMYVYSPIGDFIGSKDLREFLQIEGEDIEKEDCISSGGEILSLLTGDDAAILALWLNHADTYTVLAVTTCRLAGLPDNTYTRQDMKEIVIPYYYGSEKILDRLCKEGMSNRMKNLVKDAFRQAYAKILNGAAWFRYYALEGWDSESTGYLWNAIDGFDCRCMNNIDRDVRIDLNFVDNGIKVKCGFTSKVKYTGTIEKGKSGSRSIGANIVHSVDAYILREIHRIMNYPSVAWRKMKVSNLVKGNKPIKDKTLIKLIDLYNKTGICTIRGLYLIDQPGLDLPEDYLKDLKKAVEMMPDEPIRVASIHDCFMFKRGNRDYFKKVMGYIMGTLYLGKYTEYLNEELELSLPIKQSVDMEVYKKIVEDIDWTKPE